MSNKVELRNMTYEEIEAYILSIGEKKFRAKQVFEWVHEKMVSSITEMTNLSKSLREKISASSELFVPKIVQCLISENDGTRKYLFEMSDGQRIETVLMRYEHGNSVCVSTQAGCRMGCTFCASGLLGLDRQLTTGEILSQIYEVEKDIEDRVTHTVLMGTGEPLDNYESVIKFIHLITDERGKNLSQRHVTLSTCGLVPEIIQLADEHLQITLAISLHASDDSTRQQTMPIAKRYSIDEVLDASEIYFNKTGRRITFEYALIAGVNDDQAGALKLARLLKRRDFRCHVNLIPVNSIDEKLFQQSTRSAVRAFQQVLLNNHIEATIRRALGTEINAACGQLRNSDSSGS